MNKMMFYLVTFLVGCNTHQPDVKTIKENGKTIFVCSPCGGSCDNLIFTQAGKCPHCGMDLIRKESSDLSKENFGKDLTICFYLQDNVELLDFAGPMEVFVVAGFHVFTVSKTKDPITSQGTLHIIPDYSIEDAPSSDVMVFFGGAHGLPTNDP